MIIRRPSDKIIAIPGIGIHILHGRVSAADWWDPAGDIGCCVAAYAAKGAASYAASKVNLANPGTYDATEGVAPDWDGTNGWKFNGSTHCLQTGVVPSATTSALVQFTSLGSLGAWSYITGTAKSGSDTRFYLGKTGSDHNIWWHADNSDYITGSLITAGNMGMTPAACYLDGANVSATGADVWSGDALEFFIGCRNVNGSLSAPVAVYCQAVAYYSSSLSDAEMLAVATAMAAL